MPDDELPYPEPDGQGRTGGWAGSDASHERAVREAADGSLSRRFAVILTLLGNLGPQGITFKEVDDLTGWHHGQSSGALSDLHKMGHVAYLPKVRRLRCGVYVLPEHVGDRETAPPGRTKANTDAYDQGFRDGAKVSADAYAEGYLDAERAMQAQVDEAVNKATSHVLGVVLGLRGAMGNPVQTHHQGCWRKHPACALEAVLAGITEARR